MSFSPRKGDFIGRHALERQQKDDARILQRDYSLLDALPRLTRPVAVTGRGIAREGAPVHAEQGAGRFGGETLLGWVTSGTAVQQYIVLSSLNSVRLLLRCFTALGRGRSRQK